MGSVDPVSKKTPIRSHKNDSSHDTPNKRTNLSIAVQSVSQIILLYISFLATVTVNAFLVLRKSRRLHFPANKIQPSPFGLDHNHDDSCHGCRGSHDLEPSHDIIHFLFGICSILLIKIATPLQLFTTTKCPLSCETQCSSSKHQPQPQHQHEIHCLRPQQCSHVERTTKTHVF